MFTANWYFTGQ